MAAPMVKARLHGPPRPHHSIRPYHRLRAGIDIGSNWLKLAGQYVPAGLSVLDHTCEPEIVNLENCQEELEQVMLQREDGEVLCGTPDVSAWVYEHPEDREKINQMAQGLPS
jgi:hypothetical protein